MEPDYETAIKRQRDENAADVLSQLDEGDAQLAVKISNFCQRWGFRRDEVHDEIRRSHVVRCFFAKDPEKQGLHEKVAASFVENIPGVSSFHLLPKGGKNALHIFEGQILRGKKLSQDAPKSLDFDWEFGGRKFYALHKFTKESGGAQDHQYREAIQFLKHAGKREKEDCHFIALCDGEYYTAAKMKEMRRECQRCTYAMKTGELKEFLLGKFARTIKSDNAK